MSKPYKTAVAAPTILALILTLAGAPALAGGRIEGLLVDVDGRAAAGFRVHLIDSSGTDVSRAAASEGGIYSFRDLPAGRYSLGVESPDGKVAPVASPPVRLSENELARRDIKLMPATPEAREAVGAANADFGLWWAGLSPWAKTWSVIGVLAFLGVTWAALDDDDEHHATPMVPEAP
jgi:hypothetical protein